MAEIKKDWARYSFYVASISLGIFAYNSLMTEIHRTVTEPIENIARREQDLETSFAMHEVRDSSFMANLPDAVNSLYHAQHGNIIAATITQR